MRAPRFLFAALASLSFVALHGADAPASAADKAAAAAWPEITRENKPWTRWWWPGSGVDKASITAQLEKIAAAGIGGVEITPIYGAKGYENRYIDFLSPQWVAMLEHTGKEAQRLGLGVDMATGTGWPFGGPWIDAAHAAQGMVLKENGQLGGKPTKQMVKRAAPGDEGLVIDPYSTEAIDRYLAPFDKAFAKLPRGFVRSQFHDSFEYYGSSWTDKLPEVFKQMHGYDLQEHAAELMGEKKIDPDTLARLKCDYRDVLAKLHLDYLHEWVQWSHLHGFLVRNQSHGAPGNLLDLYANADIAETEIFGSAPFPIPGLRRNADEIRSDQDLPEGLVMKMASSAGHVVGHNLSSSESFTWLREHFKESPSYMKPEADRLFCNGINHIFFHGTVFSPSDAPWPGWLFYAATQYNPNNPLWDDLANVNHYIARVQSVLQRGEVDNDVLIYWPIEDIWDNPEGTMIQLAVHNVTWLDGQPFGKLATRLEKQGYSFDYISDAQLQETKVEKGTLVTAGKSRYKTIVVPVTRRMPVETAQRLAQLASDGARIIFEKLPEDVPGLGHLEERRAKFRAAVEQLGNLATVHADVPAELVKAGVSREPVADEGVSFIRRTNLRPDGKVAGHSYFFANLSGKPLDSWVELGCGHVYEATFMDPLTTAVGDGAVQRGTKDHDKLYLQLAPGQSMIVRTREWESQLAQFATLPAWPYRHDAGAPVELTGSWLITFTKGGPELPPAIVTKELKSWTDLGGDEAKRFAGTAHYRLEFDAPAAKADDWSLDLGDVREVARVRLNGHDITTAWSLPFRVRVGPYLQPGRNVLDLDVTNLAANRIRDMDIRKVDWKIMREINFVNINYKPFDASDWKVTPAGLLSPVKLVPQIALKPNL